MPPSATIGFSPSSPLFSPPSTRGLRRLFAGADRLRAFFAFSGSSVGFRYTVAVPPPGGAEAESGGGNAPALCPS